MMSASRSFFAATLLCFLLSLHSAAGRRDLAQFYPELFSKPAVNDAVGAARNATAAARTLLVLAQAVEAELTIQSTADIFLAGHIAADAAGSAAEVGQRSAAIAASEASAAAAIANVAAINKSEEYVALAQQLIQQAEELTAAVQQEDNSTLTPQQTASDMLFPRIAHDGSLILYFANETNGMAGNGEVFNETVYFAAGVEDASANVTILTDVQTQLEAGANPGLGLTALHVVLHEMLGAIYAYEGDFDQVLAQQVEVSSVVRKANQILASNPTVELATVQPLLDAAGPALTSGLETANAAASGAPDAGERVSALLASIQELDAQAEAAEDAIQVPALAAAPTMATANAGR